MAKKHDAFVPELDGKGRVLCPVDAKTMKRINTKQKSPAMAEAMKAAFKGPNAEFTGGPPLARPVE